MKHDAIYSLILLGLVIIVFTVVLSHMIAQGQTDVVSGRDGLPMGPLVVHPGNSRYFTDGTGRAIYLTGSHTWASLQDIRWVRESSKYSDFSYSDYLSFLSRYKHNFFRLWVWEQAAWLSTVPGHPSFSPLPYPRTGPGNALDGKLKFDINRFDKAYFERLRSRVNAAREKGIYVAIMLFNGFSLEMKGHTEGGNPWRGHPFQQDNNINKINGDPDRRDDGKDVHTLRIPAITALQEAYVAKVIDTVHDLDNVFYEIANESHAQSTKWQYHMIDFIHSYETRMWGVRHPVLMTAQWPGGTNEALFESPAEAVCPNEAGGYKENPPEGNGRKIILSDTDHLWGVGGDYRWVWKTFLRGLNPIFMDPYNIASEFSVKKNDLELARNNMGYTLRLAKRINLATMTPQSGIASSTYCLADPGKAYLAYASGGRITMDLTNAPGHFGVEWLNPVTGKTKEGTPVAGGGSVAMVAPFTDDGILYLFNKQIAESAQRSR
jgi:hypothetical protein